MTEQLIQIKKNQIEMQAQLDQFLKHIEEAMQVEIEGPRQL